jgi:hypothetical protein
MTNQERADGARTAEDVVRSFAAELARLRELHGSPSFARMQAAVRHTAKAAGSKNTFHRMITSPERIYEPEFVWGFVVALGLSDDEAQAWEQRRIQALREYQALRDKTPPRAADGQRERGWHAGSRVTAVAVTAVLALGLALTAAAFFGGGQPGAVPPSAASHRSARPAGGGGITPPRDGADPEDSGCARDPAVVALDSTEVDYRGRPAGLDELWYSPRCGVAWARFQPFPDARIPAGAIIHVDVFRPGSGNLEEAYQAPYVGAAVYGNVLQSTATCVYATATIEEAGKELPESHTLPAHAAPTWRLSSPGGCRCPVAWQPALLARPGCA